MSLEIGSKNPISVLTEYSVKLNLNLRFENTTLKTGEFLFRVLKGQMQLGLGQDKKKQRAKSLAAESAINYLKSSSCPEDVEDQLSNELHKLKKTGNYKLVSANPYVLDYYIDNLLVATGKGVSQAIARKNCAEKALLKLQELETSPSHSPKSNKADKSCQIERIHSIDPRVFSQKTAFEQAYMLYFENKYSSFEIPQRLSTEIVLFAEEILEMARSFSLSIQPIGSYSLGILRNNKTVLDFGMVLQAATESVIFDIYDRLQRARLNFLESKDKGIKMEGHKLAMSIELIENTMNSYTSLPYFFVSRNNISANIYIYDSDTHPSLIHYQWMKSDKPAISKTKTCALLRYWRQKLSIEIPAEFLDVLVENFVNAEMPCGLGFRIVCEKISSGIFLPGAVSLTQDLCHDSLMMRWPARFRYSVLKEAGRTLVAISQGELSQLFDDRT